MPRSVPPPLPHANDVAAGPLIDQLVVLRRTKREACATGSPSHIAARRIDHTSLVLYIVLQHACCRTDIRGALLPDVRLVVCAALCAHSTCGRVVGLAPDGALLRHPHCIGEHPVPAPCARLIEAPWLANSGHGVSISIPYLPAPCLSHVCTRIGVAKHDRQFSVNPGSRDHEGTR
jgi:hypothetical protein